MVAEELDATDIVRGWLTVILWHQCADLRASGELRAWKARTTVHEDALAVAPEPRLEAREALRVISYRLSRDERTLLDAVGRGLTAEEIATMVGVPAGTVHTRLRKLRGILRKRARR